MHQTSQNINLEQNRKIEKLYAALNTKIACKTHPQQEAKSICKDCKTFCCMIENCGQPHIYHQIENIDYLLTSQILPFLSNLKEANENFAGNKMKYSSNLHSFKNRLKNFSVDAKKIIDDEHKKILNSLQIIYNSQMEDISEFSDNLSAKFEAINEKISKVYPGGQNSDVSEINSYLNNLVAQARDNETFLTLISKDAKKLNLKLKEIHSTLTKFDFQKEINDVKTQAEKEYPLIDRTEYFQNLSKNFENEANTFLKSKQKKEERKSISKMKKMVSMRQTMMQDNFNLDLDLDIFVRNLFEEVNKIRQNPSEALKFLDQYLETISSEESILNQTFVDGINININANNKVNYLYEYINNVAGLKLPAFEWDNDMSNSAEDYLRTSNGKAERDPKALLIQMKDIIQNSYYTEYQNVSCLSYTGSPELNKIIISTFLNEANWNPHTKQNILFDGGFNLSGFCACVSPGYNKIVLIMNFSLLNRK